MLVVALVICLAWTRQVNAQASSLFRSVDGSKNNFLNPLWGACDQEYLRLMPTRSYDYAERPSARELSVKLFGLTEPISSNNTVNALAVYMGQFLAHDILRSTTNASDQMPMPIPQCDEDYDKNCLGNVSLPFSRQAYTIRDGVKVYPNSLSAWVDASMVYGNSTIVTKSLRSFTDGLLKLTSDGMLTLIDNSAGIMEGASGFPWTKLMLAGDIRANENAALQTLHILFAREHNRRAQVLKQRYPIWSDEILFQNARKWVIGVWQKIVFDEYTPGLLGSALATYKGYNASINPNIDVFFMAASFRYGHSAVPNLVMEVDDNGQTSPQGHYVLRDTLFNPSYVLRYGIECVLRGLIIQPESKVDTLITRELRTPYKNGMPFDLPAMNIQRGRDLNLSSYNDARRYFKLTPVNTTADITSDLATQMMLEVLYNGNVENIDAFVGGLAEDRTTSGRVGPMFAASLAEQLTRLRDADRYYYKSNTSSYSASDRSEIDNFSFQQMVLLNTAIKKYPSSMFTVADAYSAFTNTTSVSTSGTSTPSKTITDGFTVNWVTSLTDATITIEFVVDYSIGWFGFGLGKSMTNVDIWILQLPEQGNPSVNDYWSSSFQPVLDTSLGGSNSFTNIQYLTNQTGHKNVVRFTRALSTGDAHDIDITNGNMDVIWAWSTASSTLAFHGTNKGSGQINFYATTSSLSSTSTSTTQHGMTTMLMIFHGVIMLMCFSVLMPIAVFIARHYHHNPNWIELHEKFASVATSEVIFAAATVIVSNNSALSILHARIGIFIFIAIIFQTMSGMLLKSGYLSLRRFSKLSRYIHIILGPIVLVFGNFNCFLGIQRLSIYDSKFETVPWIFLGWVLIVILIFIYAEYRKHKAKLCPKPAANTPSRVISVITNKNGLILPEFKWDDFNQRINRGSLWLVVDDVIYDIGQFANAHPGGISVIYYAVGTDATSMFDGTYGKDGTSIRRNKAHLQTTSKRFSISASTNKASKKYSHVHSRLALMRLQSLAVGVISQSPVENIGDFVPKCITRMIPTGRFGFTKFQAKALTLSQKISLVPLDATKMVYRFRFDFEEATDELMCFPGDYVLLHIVTKLGKVIQRPYTPIKCHSTGHIDLIIKAYDDGIMTSELSTLVEGDMVALRGPMRGTDVLRQSTERGCYSSVGMIVCGSGITPALLLIDYYLDNGQRDIDGKLLHSLSLLFVNSTEKDVFYRAEFDKLISRSNGALKVHYVVRHDNDGKWTGLKGCVTSQMIIDLMPKPGKLSYDKLGGQLDHPLAENMNGQILRTVLTKSIMSNASMVSIHVPPLEVRETADITEYNTNLHNSSHFITSSGLLSVPHRMSQSKNDFIGGPFAQHAHPIEHDVQMVVCGCKTFNQSVRQLLSSIGYSHDQIIAL